MMAATTVWPSMALPSRRTPMRASVHSHGVAPLFRLAVRRVRTGHLLRSCGNELLLVVVVLRLSVVPRGRAIGLLATEGIPLQIAADREKGRASWRQAGLPAQSLQRHRFRRALRAFICTFCMRVCIYVYMCMCADMIYVYICMCVCICTSMRLYTCVCVYVYAYLCIDCGS